MGIHADPRRLASEYFQRAGEMAYKSAAAVPEDKATFKPAPGAKSALEILQHTVEVNERFIKGLERLGAQLDDNDMARIAASTEDYPKSLDAFESTNARLVSAIANLPEEALMKDGKLDLGESSLYKRMEVGALHMIYHWGQIAMLQTFWDDQEDHFMKR